MSVVLVQSKVGGNFSGSVGSGGTAYTSAVGFDSTTGAGNLLVAVVYSYGPGLANYEVDVPITGGGYAGSWNPKCQQP
jgi:hypothetical protein